MHEVDLLIFDLDGTLLDTRQDLANAVNHARESLGFEPLEIPTVMNYVGDGLRKLLQRAFPNATNQQLDEATRLFRRFYADHLLDYSTLYPGVPQVLGHYRDKDMAIVSNKPYEFTRAILDGLQMSHYFSVILGGDSLPNPKPSPDPLLHVLAEFTVSADRAVMIGDSPSDIHAGRAAGMKTCAVTYGYRSPALLRSAEPDELVDRVSDVRRLFV